jgi:hypothetical protein
MKAVRNMKTKQCILYGERAGTRARLRRAHDGVSAAKCIYFDKYLPEFYSASSKSSMLML